MYFDFEDHRPDTPLLARPLTRLEQILLTIIAYLLIVISLIVYPRLPFVKAAQAARLEKLEQERKRQQEILQDRMQFAFAMPTTPDATIVRNEPSKNPTMENRGPGLLSDAIKNVQKYSQGATLQNLEGNGDSGPSLQFDSKGVDFGSWLRRFRAQVYRNWLIPYAAMALHGHTVLRFTIHRDGAITDLIVLQPSSIDAFTKAAFNAIKTSNPTVVLPEAYPDESMVMTVIFYYNETPPG